LPLDAIDPTVAAVSALLGGLVGIVLAGLRGLLRGRLVPAVTLDTLMAQWQAQLAESHVREEQWRTAYLRAEEARAVTSQQLGELMILARTMDAFLRSLPPAHPAPRSSPPQERPDDA
jgi:hypothetical protein